MKLEQLSKQQLHLIATIEELLEVLDYQSTLEVLEAIKFRLEKDI